MCPFEVQRSDSTGAPIFSYYQNKFSNSCIGARSVEDENTL
jgi:hypothetical protein